MEQKIILETEAERAGYPMGMGWQFMDRAFLACFSFTAYQNAYWCHNCSRFLIHYKKSSV